jgi:hypothetical protein
MYFGLHVKYLLFWLDFDKTWIFSKLIRKTVNMKQMLKTCKPTVLFHNDVTLSFMYFILLRMICNTFSFKIYLYVTYLYRLEILTLLLITIQFVLHVMWTMQDYATLICFTCIVSTCSISYWVITQCCMDQLNINKI